MTMFRIMVQYRFIRTPCVFDDETHFDAPGIVNLILHCVIQGIYPTNYFTKRPLYQIRVFLLLMTFLSCDYFFLSWDIWLEAAGVTSHTRGNSWQKKYRKRISIENVFYWLDRVKQAQDGFQHRGDVWGFHGISHLDRRDCHGNFRITP